VARRRLKIAYVVAGVFVVGLATASGLLRPATVAYILMVVAWILAWMLPLGLMRGGQNPVVHGERFLTAWTLAGRRTVDLRRLVMVDRLGMSRSTYGDVLVLRDVNGMELSISSRIDLSRTVRQAVADALANQEAGWPEVTRSAAHGLRVAEVPLRERFTGNVPWAVKGLLYGVGAFVAVNIVGAVTAGVFPR
jgi:hypothetical protein